MPAVDPTALREALAELPGHSFRVGEEWVEGRGGQGAMEEKREARRRSGGGGGQEARTTRLALAGLLLHALHRSPCPSPTHPPTLLAGEMNDAAEVLLCVYEKVMEVAGALGRPAGIDATFGLQARGGRQSSRGGVPCYAWAHGCQAAPACSLHSKALPALPCGRCTPLTVAALASRAPLPQVAEAVHCGRCGRATHQNCYTQYFYNTQAGAALPRLQMLAMMARDAGAGASDSVPAHPPSTAGTHAA